MKNLQLLVITHRLYFSNEPKLGGIDRIIEYLSKENRVSLIEHPFEVINHPSVFTSNNKKNTHQSIMRGALLWVEEFIITMWWLLRNGQQYDLAIGADPLTFFSCSIAKKIGRVKKTQFHSTDYSTRRFSNPFIEFIYQQLYLYAISSADIMTVVSSRMKEKVGRGYLLPNSPNFEDVPKISPDKKNPHDLVFMVGMWGEQVNTNTLIACLKAVMKKNKQIKLHIIGHVDKKYKKLFFQHDLDKNIVFHGTLSYSETLQKMSECYIGITAYKNTESYVHYADSLKIREYAAAGLPIVCDNIYATASEVKKNGAGLVYKTPQEMATVIIRLIEAKETYEEKSKNALQWARKMDKRVSLDQLYKT